MEGGDDVVLGSDNTRAFVFVQVMASFFVQKTFAIR